MQTEEHLINAELQKLHNSYFIAYVCITYAFCLTRTAKILHKTNSALFFLSLYMCSFYQHILPSTYW